MEEASPSNINTSSPTEKYPCPTELNVLDFVPNLLPKKNYQEWKRLMQGFIKWQGLIGFIDGTVKEEKSNQDFYKTWKRSDNLVQGWMLKTFPKDFRLSVFEQDLKTAKDLWAYTEREFELKHFEILDAEADHRLTEYLPLYKAAIKGDWSKAAAIIQVNPDAARTPINRLYETALMVAIESKGRNHFVEKLLKKMTPQDVRKADKYGYTALHHAARFGNTEGAKMLIAKNAGLPNVKDQKQKTPLRYAAELGIREMVIYLMQVTSKDIQLADHEPDSGSLLSALTTGELYDIASTLLKRKPELVIDQKENKGKPELERVESSPLRIIVEKKSSFKSGNSFNFLENLVYWGVPIKSSIANSDNEGGRRERDIENPANCCISGLAR